MFSSVQFLLHSSKFQPVFTLKHKHETFVNLLPLLGWAQAIVQMIGDIPDFRSCCDLSFVRTLSSPTKPRLRFIFLYINVLDQGQAEKA